MRNISSEPAWRRFERRVYSNARQLYEVATGRPGADLVFFHDVRVQGVYRRHQVDVFGQSPDAAVAIECKAWGANVDDSEIVRFAAACTDIAAHRPDRAVIGILVSASGFGRDAVKVTQFEHMLPPADARKSLALHFVDLGDEIWSPYELVNVHQPDGVGLELVVIGDHQMTIDEAMWAATSAASPMDRVVGGLHLVHAGRSGDYRDTAVGAILRGQGALSAGNAMLHLGQFSDAISVLRSVGDDASALGTETTQEATLTGAIASWRRNQTHGANRRPGAKAASSINRLLRSQSASPHQEVSMRLFCDLWVSRYDDREAGLDGLRRSVGIASALDEGYPNDPKSDVWLYFLSSARLAEMTDDSAEGDLHIQTAQTLLESLAPKHLTAGRELVDRLTGDVPAQPWPTVS
ncbi:hypothetical protein ACXPWS_00160 [Mycobacterium sp. BMJ-28]